MTPSPGFRVRLVDWREASGTLSAIRTTVFVGEQGVPPEIEIDGRDPGCAHVVAESDSGGAVGTGRLMPEGRIGRMAVLAAWRGRGVGAAMLEALVAEAKRRGFRETYLHAQAHAKDFYARHGFVVEGEEYLEAGIPHVLMRAPT
ncbi:MAG: GNAT family N-acetyltransferase [Burkholderiales bacterium]|nr:GNAT family N-acetyltransferase [Burkholderiales bacterium]MCL4690591.1 GNAT family N-acetyltransferase [Burkholderiales bacterium]